MGLGPTENLFNCGVSQGWLRLLAQGLKCQKQIPGRVIVIQGRSVGLLAKFLALFVDDYRNVQPMGWLGTQGPEDLLLLRGHVEQVRAANHMGDALVDIVDNDCQLIGVEIFLAQNDRIVQFGVHHLYLGAKQIVLPVTCFLFEGKANGVWAIPGAGVTSPAPIGMVAVVVFELFA